MNGALRKAVQTALCLGVSLLPASAALAASDEAVPAQNASGSFWLPFSASPTTGTTGGKSGLFVIASNEIDTSPAPQWITTKAVRILGSAYNYGSTLSDFQPQLVMYASAGTDGNTHVYGLTLSNTASLPKPAQIGSLSINAASEQICGIGSAQTSLKEPTSLFVVLAIGVAGADGCILPTTQKIVHFTDSETTAPEATSLPTSTMDALYLDGAFRGAFAFDLITGKAYLYNAELKSSVLLSGVEALPLVSAFVSDGTEFGNDVLYFDAIGAASPALYRIDAKSLTLSKVASGIVSIGGAFADENNVYYIVPAPSTSFYQAPLAGGASKLLYTAATPANSAYAWIGSTESTLVFQNLEIPGGTNITEAASNVYSIPVGKSSASATKIGGPYTGTVTGFLDAASATAKWNVYLTVTHQLSTGANSPFKFSSVEVPLDGPYTQTPVADSAYGGPLIYSSSPAFWQVTGITDTRGWGGGQVSLVDLATATTTKFTTTGGKDFTMPVGHDGLLIGFPGQNIAVGDFYTLNSLSVIGVAVDLTHHFIYTIGIPDTNVTAF
jgi:hypothetical protein